MSYADDHASLIAKLTTRANGQPSKGRRRGKVFSVRVTDDERAALERLRAHGDGPQAIGPWMLWRALGGEPGDRAGTTETPPPTPDPVCDACKKLPASHHVQLREGPWIRACLDCYRSGLTDNLAESHPISWCTRCPLRGPHRCLPNVFQIDHEIAYRKAILTGKPYAVPDHYALAALAPPGPIARSSGTTRSSGTVSRVAARRRGTTSPDSDVGVVPGRGAEVLPPPASRLILDLCAGSGAWSEPYRRAGYRVERVTLPETDVRTFTPPPNVWGVLAAPPCTEFSIAKNGRRRDFTAGMETVNACMRVILQARPRWWALENPGSGLLAGYLGTPRDSFEPHEFGDPWTKLTALWGEFALPKRGPFVKPLGGGPLCTACDPAGHRASWCSSAAHRAKTPDGFARAFFEANP
jgi:hypothetical protein